MRYLPGYLLSLISRVIHAVVFNGSPYMTLSARAYLEAVRNPEQDAWDTYRRWINRLFFWQRDAQGNLNHCQRAWNAEVDRAEATILALREIE